MPLALHAFAGGGNRWLDQSLFILTAKRCLKRSSDDLLYQLIGIDSRSPVAQDIMTGSGVTKSVALMTPTYRGDLDRFALLCESLDRFVSGYDRHYVIVNDDDVALFARFDNSRRTVLPSSRFLPCWLKALPRFVSRKGRRTWWSFRSGPLHGWHIQQLLRIREPCRCPISGIASSIRITCSFVRSMWPPMPAGT